MFEHSGPGGRPKYCPECREQYANIYRARRAKQARERRGRKSDMESGAEPALVQGMRSVLREMECFNEARRAEGKPIVTYGKFIAIRDKRMPDREHP